MWMWTLWIYWTTIIDSRMRWMSNSATGLQPLAIMVIQRVIKSLNMLRNQTKAMQTLSFNLLGNLWDKSCYPTHQLSSTVTSCRDFKSSSSISTRHPQTDSLWLTHRMISTWSTSKLSLKGRRLWMMLVKLVPQRTKTSCFRWITTSFQQSQYRWTLRFSNYIKASTSLLHQSSKISRKQRG